MPEEEVIERAREDEREGKSTSTEAGEFVREEMEHIREGDHGARSPEQAIAIGLSKARRAGVKLPPSKRGKQRTKRQAKRDLTKGRTARRWCLRRFTFGHLFCHLCGSLICFAFSRDLLRPSSCHLCLIYLLSLMHGVPLLCY